MKEISDKVFCGPTKIFNVFKQFDKDGDGFVSYADFDDKLQQLEIQSSRKDLAAVLKLLDKDQKGYLDFQNFSKGVHPGMAEAININNRELHLPNLVPNRAKLNEYAAKGKGLFNAVNEVRRTF